MPPKKLVLIVVDGMTPAGFERALAGNRAPALSFLAEHGTYQRATSVFPSSRRSASVDRHGWDRRASHPTSRLVASRQRRIVEYSRAFMAGVAVLIGDHN